MCFTYHAQFMYFLLPFLIFTKKSRVVSLHSTVGADDGDSDSRFVGCDDNLVGAGEIVGTRFSHNSEKALDLEHDSFFIQVYCEEILAYTPGYFAFAQPIPHDTTPTRILFCLSNNGPPRVEKQDPKIARH